MKSNEDTDKSKYSVIHPIVEKVVIKNLKILKETVE